MKKILFSLLAIVLTTNILIGQHSGSKSRHAMTNDIDMIVFQIASANVVHESAIGIAGSKSSQYKRYEVLAAEASIDKLVQLTSHDNPAVRVYAYKALLSKDYKALAQITEVLEKDESTISYMNGCIMSDATVADIISDKKSPVIPIQTGFKISGISGGRM